MGGRDEGIAAIRDRLEKMLGSSGAAPPAAGGGDDLAQSMAYIDALDAELGRVRTDAASTVRRIAEMSNVIGAIVAFDFTKRAPYSDKSDALDGLAVGLNVLTEDLSRSMVSKAYVNNIIESMTDLLIVLEKDGRIRAANAAAAHLSGRKREELIGQPINLLFSELDAGDIIDKKRVSYAEILCHKKASAAVLISFSAAVMLNRKGEFEGIVCVGRDLTEAKRAEEERLRIGEAMQRQAILLQETSTPLIPITDDIMVMPIIGPVDQERARQICEVLLRGVVQSRSRTAILDITGMQAVAQPAVQGILSAVQSLRLVGAEVVLTGVRPEVAMELVNLDVDLTRVRTSRSLQSGIVDALRSQSSRRSRE